MNELINLAETYEAKVLQMVKPSQFYRELSGDNTIQDFITVELTKGLTWVGSGSCSWVFTNNKGYVLKLHVPWGEKISLLSNPSKQDIEWATKARDNEENRHGYAIDIRYFLPFNYITKNGFAGVQKQIDCSKKNHANSERQVEIFWRICITF